MWPEVKFHPGAVYRLLIPIGAHDADILAPDINAEFVHDSSPGALVAASRRNDVQRKAT
jgi:hypothetical protein